MAFLSMGILRQYLKTFLGSNQEDRKRWYWSIFFIWQTISILGIIEAPAYLVLIINILIVLFMTFIYEGNILQKLFLAIVYNSIWMLMEFFVGYFFIILGINYASQGLLGSLMSKALLLILVRALQVFFTNDKISELPYSYNMALMLIPVGSMFIVYNSFMISSEVLKKSYIYSSILTIIIMFIIDILIFTIYLKLSEYLNLRQKNIVYKQEIDFYNKHIEEKENSMLEFRKAKHDLKNQLIYLLELSENHKYLELENFLKKLVESEPLDTLIVAQTDNSIVDALVNYKYALARKYGIDFMVKLDVPSSILIDSTDMCVILGNVLDNALEANLRLDSVRRYIKLLMRLDLNNLIIIVENSFDGNIKRNKAGKILSMKHDVNNHGIGLESLKKSVDRYNGFLKMDIKENIFTIKIVLYISKKKLHE